MTGTALSVGIALAIAVVLIGRHVAPALTRPARVPVVVGRQPTSRFRRWGWSSGGRRRAVRLDEQAVAGWCRRVAAGLRSGRSMSTAVVDATDGGAASPFPDVAHAVGRGRPLGEAFRATPDDPSTPVGLAAPVLATCAELGGPAAGAVERLADVLMARSTAREERRAASAQAQLSATVLTVVPLGVVVLLALVEPAIRRTIATPAGSLCLVAGAALDGLGWTWMRRMIGGPG